MFQVRMEAMLQAGFGVELDSGLLGRFEVGFRDVLMEELDIVLVVG